MNRFIGHSALQAALLVAWTAASPRLLAEQPPQARGPASRVQLQKLNGEIAQIMAQVSPAVVQIQVTGLGPSEESQRAEAVVVERQHSLGSGIIVDSDGFILTNEHVIHGAQRIRVLLPPIPGTLPSGNDSIRRRMFEARVIGSQPDVDLALLKIEASHLPVVSLDKATPARKGELVFAIGSPEGLASSVTMGIVSATERQVENTFPMMFIQTDAPINPGNSGGPLVDAEGSLVGLNAFILTRSGGSEGLGFAIPAATVKFVYQSLRTYGRVRRIDAGVLAQPITPALAIGLDLPRDWGVIIADVDPNGAAKAAGVQPGDIIESFDGMAIYSLPSLTGAVFVHPIDQPVALKVLRGQETLTLEIRAPEAMRPTDLLAELATTDKGLVRRLGVVGADIDERIRAIMPHLRSGSGVVVGARIQDASSAETGLKAGDVIRSLNQAQIDSLDTLRKAVRGLKAGEAVALQIERDGKLAYLAFEME